MNRTYFFVLIFFVLSISAQNADSQSLISGQVVETGGEAVHAARITLFNATLSYFQEERTNSAGAFSFSDVPPGNYSMGVEKKGKEYVEQTIAVPLNNPANVTLEAETNTGIWEIIIDSPEALGGTDLGVLMPDGKIYYCHSTKDPFYFDPVSNDTIFTIGDVNVQGCVGPIQNEDGKVWFMGGTLQETYGPGTRRVKNFNPVNNSWKIQPEMLDYRWYPTVALLPNGKFLIAGGGNLDNPVRTNTSEIYDPSTGQSFFTGDLAIGNEVSPIVVLYNGKVLMTHRPPQLFDPETNQWANAGSFVQSPRTPNGDHSDCELVLMADGEAIAVGYKTFTPGVYGSFIERYDPELDVWSLGSSMLPIRSRAKTCLLPDKKILVMGGYKEDQTNAIVNQWGYMKLTDLYDPAADSWRRLDNLNYFREYHALTILVPDGRVIAVGGEGAPGNEPPFSVIEAFKPPYLFRGVRPEIDSLYQTSFARGGEIELDYSKTDSVTEVILMSNAVVTHFMNSGNNRYLSLDYTQSNNHITASLPRDSVKLIPGYYMLFIMVDDIPSVGKIVHVQNEVFEAAPIGFLDSTFIWTENHYYSGGSHSFKYTIDSEPSFVSGKTYYAVLRTDEEQSEQWVPEAYIRSENNIVYMYTTPEAELYNFNLMVGDTFAYGITSVVDSIDTIFLLTGEERKRWKLRCIYDDIGNAVFTEWVEGIGNINGLFAVNDMTNCTADGDGSNIMCMYRNDTLIYDDPEIDGCWLLPTETYEINEDDIFFTPNPAIDFITIGGLKQEIKYLKVFNIVGNLVYQGNKDRIDVHEFPAGYYYAILMLDDNHTLSKGFIKQ